MTALKKSPKQLLWKLLLDDSFVALTILKSCLIFYFAAGPLHSITIKWLLFVLRSTSQKDGFLVLLTVVVMFFDAKTFCKWHLLFS